MFRFERHNFNRHRRSCPRGSGGRDRGRDAGRDGRMNDRSGGGGFAFVIRALTSVNLIKTVCVCECKLDCMHVCAPISGRLQAQRRSIDGLSFISRPKVD